MLLPDDPVLTLFRFHQKARAAMEQLTNLAAKSRFNTTDIQARDALARFLIGPLAWHDLDEEASVNRRIRARAKYNPDVIAAITRVGEQHEILETAADSLIACLATATSGPDIADAVHCLNASLAPHLKDEERTIFPAARAYLTATDLSEIASEIAGRAARRAKKTPAVIELKREHSAVSGTRL